MARGGAQIRAHFNYTAGEVARLIGVHKTHRSGMDQVRAACRARPALLFWMPQATATSRRRGGLPQDWLRIMNGRHDPFYADSLKDFGEPISAMNDGGRDCLSARSKKPAISFSNISRSLTRSTEFSRPGQSTA
jgi:hypothetical protein